MCIVFLPFLCALYCECFGVCNYASVYHVSCLSLVIWMLIVNIVEPCHVLGLDMAAPDEPDADLWL